MNTAAYVSSLSPDLFVSKELALPGLFLGTFQGLHGGFITQDINGLKKPFVPVTVHQYSHRNAILCYRHSFIQLINLPHDIEKIPLYLRNRDDLLSLSHVNLQ